MTTLIRNQNYLEHIHLFNSAFAMASIQLKSVDIPGRGKVCLKIHGQTYHTVATICQNVTFPPACYNPRWIIYSYSDEALEHRVRNVTNASCNKQLMAILQTMF